MSSDLFRHLKHVLHFHVRHFWTFRWSVIFMPVIFSAPHASQLPLEIAKRKSRKERLHGKCIYITFANANLNKASTINSANTLQIPFPFTVFWLRSCENSHRFKQRFGQCHNTVQTRISLLKIRREKQGTNITMKLTATTLVHSLCSNVQQLHVTYLNTSSTHNVNTGHKCLNALSSLKFLSVTTQPLAQHGSHCKDKWQN